MESLLFKAFFFSLAFVIRVGVFLRIPFIVTGFFLGGGRCDEGNDSFKVFGCF